MLLLYRKAIRLQIQAITEALIRRHIITDAVPNFNEIRARFRKLFGTSEIEDGVRKASGGLTREIDRNIARVSPSALIVGGEAELLAFRQRNVSLIVRTADDTLARVRKLLEERAFEHPTALKAALQVEFGISRRKAELWARDQTLKLAGQIQQSRQVGAGITQYVWRTSEDERVREDHMDLDGTIQSWKEPPVVDTRTERRAHPGGDFQCRCTAEPILPD